MSSSRQANRKAHDPKPEGLNAQRKRKKKKKRAARAKRDAANPVRVKPGTAPWGDNSRDENSRVGSFVTILAVSLLWLRPACADVFDEPIIKGHSCLYEPDYEGHVTIPDNVTRIPLGAFDSCHSLKSVTIPNSVTSIEPLAFRNTGLTSVTIPSSVNRIATDAFTWTGSPAARKKCACTKNREPCSGNPGRRKRCNKGRKKPGYDPCAKYECSISWGYPYPEGKIVRCDKRCDNRTISCNPICGHEGCTLEALNKLDCPGTENCTKVQCPNGDRHLKMSAGAIGLIFFGIFLALLIIAGIVCWKKKFEEYCKRLKGRKYEGGS